VRKPAGAEVVLASGGKPVLGDVLDPDSVRRAMEGCSAAIHVAASYPDSPAEAERARRIRVDGTRNLATAARAVGARRLVVGSGYWVYADQTGALSEESTLDPRGESRTNREAELAGLEFASPGSLDVMVVRPGMVYGNGSWFRGMVDAIRAGSYRVPGEGKNHWSLVELDDTAAAFRAVLERGVCGEKYLVVDDHPIPLQALLELVAGELGVPVPANAGEEALRRDVGNDVAHHLMANRAGSNRRLRSLGWVPRFPDCRTGLPLVLKSM